MRRPRSLRLSARPLNDRAACPCHCKLNCRTTRKGLTWTTHFVLSAANEHPNSPSPALPRSFPAAARGVASRLAAYRLADGQRAAGARPHLDPAGSARGRPRRPWPRGGARRRACRILFAARGRLPLAGRARAPARGVRGLRSGCSCIRGGGAPGRERGGSVWRDGGRVMDRALLISRSIYEIDISIPGGTLIYRGVRDGQQLALADELGLLRVSVPRLRLGSIKPKGGVEKGDPRAAPSRAAPQVDLADALADGAGSGARDVHAADAAPDSRATQRESRP